ncbi:hypothetical protein SMICM304S_04377 [Streptomyces microflavus]
MSTTTFPFSGAYRSTWSAASLASRVYTEAGSCSLMKARNRVRERRKDGSFTSGHPPARTAYR